MTLPLLVSVPHAGLTVPPEVQDLCILPPDQIRADSDEGAADIYNLRYHVSAYLTADVARAIVDLNRPVSDRRPDGVVKTHTCWNRPIYQRPLPESLIQILLNKYYLPYHQKLIIFGPPKSAKPKITKQTQFRLALDCHTMLPIGPPIGPDPGRERPWVCLSHAGGTCPDAWLEIMADCFRETFGNHVSINDPFQGGYIIRSHAEELPWMQVELSRGDFLNREEKQQRVLRALTRFCERSI